MRLLLFLLLPVGALAQTMSGRVTDANTGELLPYASIYVQQTGSGATTNEDGRYEIRLAPGRNDVVFQYLGYQTQTIEVRYGRDELDIELIPEALDLEEVTIISGDEDKSYSVIRRAIAKADYHRNQVDRYTVEVYTKGGGEVEKVPGLLLKFLDKEDREEAEEVIGKTFTSESRIRLTYERPNTVKEEVISRFENGDGIISVKGFTTANFYQPEIAETVSPLAPRSFAYYRFVHEGAFADQGELIHKIQVVPRSRGEDVFEGYVYIVDGNWALHSLDLRTYRTGFTIDIEQNYNEVEDDVWMPTATRLYASGGMVGVKFNFNYVTVASDYDITLNPDLGGYVEVIDEKTQPEEAREVRQKNRSTEDYEQTLEQGGELTRKELRRLMRQYEKEERAEQDDPEVVSDYTFVDSNATVIRDSAEWEALRPIPLTTEEIEGYKFQDSLAVAAKRDSTERANSGEEVAEDEVEGKKSFRWLRLDFEPDATFNPVEGYALGATVSKNLRIRDGRDTTRDWRSLGRLSVRARYGFAWNRLIWETGYERKNFYVRGGRFERQFNATPAIDPYINAVWALLAGENYARLYERAYVTTGYGKKLNDGLRIDGSFTYEDRRSLTNNTNHRWGGDEEFTYVPNAPFNEELNDRPVGFGDAAILQLDAEIQPGLKYRIRNGRRLTIEDSAPTINVGVTQGIPGLLESDSDFTHLRAGIRHRFEAGRKGDINFLVRGGAFVNANRVDFPDYRHFNTSEIFLTRLDPIGSYRLLPYYRNSTAEEYLEGYFHYQFRKFLLTQIFELHLMGLKEDLFVNYLYTPTSDHYTELGYSLDNILRVLRLEFVTSFRDGAYEDFGVRVSLTTSFF